MTEVIMSRADSSGRGISAAELAVVSTPTDLTAALHKLWENSGKPSTRQLVIYSKGALRKTTINDLLNGTSIRPEWQTVWELVKVLYGTSGDPDQQRWYEGWKKAREGSRLKRGSPKRKSILDRYPKISRWARTYVGMEEIACAIFCYEPQLIPGLLQTDEYASAVISRFPLPPEEARQNIELRKERKRRLLKGELRLWALVDEAVLLKPVGGVDVQIRQLRYLYEQCKENSNLTLKVRRDGPGAHIAPTGFSILEFAGNNSPDVVYVELLNGAAYIDRPADVDVHREFLDLLSRSVDDSQQTTYMLSQLINELEE